jgi:hypothetical protein
MRSSLTGVRLKEGNIRENQGRVQIPKGEPAIDPCHVPLVLGGRQVRICSFLARYPDG